MYSRAYIPDLFEEGNEISRQTSRGFIGVLLFWALVACLPLACKPGRPLEIGDSVPEFTVFRLSGEAVSLKDFASRNIFVHFWATWCPPCLVELPALARLSRRLNQYGIVLLAVCVDKTEAGKVKEFLESGGYDLPVYLDPGGRVAASFGTFKFPETYVVGRDGKIVRKVLGPANWDDPSWERFLHSLVEKSS